MLDPEPITRLCTTTVQHRGGQQLRHHLIRSKDDDFASTLGVPVEHLLLVLNSAAPPLSEQLDEFTKQKLSCPGDPATCPLWLEIREHAQEVSIKEPLLGSFMYATILNHRTLPKALSHHLAEKLGDGCFNSMQLHALFDDIFDHYDSDMAIRFAIRADLLAIRTRDAACKSLCDAFLYYKGFLGLQAHRMAHALWTRNREDLARLLQARISTVFSMDIHPACKLGGGLLFDHASGVVIGETAVVGDGCSFLHNVTLGGTGKQGGDRHPKLGCNVSVGAGVSILGNIKIGDGSKIGAGSVVLREVPEGATVVGIPARVVVPKVASEPNLAPEESSANEGSDVSRQESEPEQRTSAELRNAAAANGEGAGAGGMTAA